MNKKDFFYLIIFLFFWLVFFRKLFFFHKFPVPGNLLVWFFSPWKEEQWPQYPGGVYKQGLFGFDTIRQIYPWRSFTTQQLLNFQWPLWNPYQFSGAPHLANFQTAIFYPLNLIYLILPQIYAWTILLISQPLLAAFFMYLFAKKMRISPLGSFLSAFSYAFSLPMSVWLIWNIHAFQFAYLPLIFYLIECYKEKQCFIYLFWLWLSLVLTFLAGHPQIFMFILIFSSLYFLYRVKKFIPWFYLCLGVIGATMVVWLPLLEYYLLASREIPSSEFSFIKTLLPWQNLITLISPDFLGNPTTDNYWGGHDYTESAVYSGVIAFTLALVTIFSKNKNKKFFTATILVVFSFCLNWFLPKILLWLKIPIFTTSTATRILFLATFSFCVLTGFGVDEFLKLKRLPKIIFFPGLIYFLLWVGLEFGIKFFSFQSWFVYLKVMKRNLILPSVIYFLTIIFLVLTKSLKNIKLNFLYLLIPLAALDLFYVANKVIPFTYKELVFPPHPLLEFLQKNSQIYRFAGTNPADFESNFATYYRLFSPEGYDTLYPRYYGELVWAAAEGRYKDDISRTTVILPFNKNKYRYRLEDLLGIKFLLNKDDHYRSEWDHDETSFPQERYQLVWQRKNWKIYENKKVLPRAFLVNNFVVIKDKRKIIEEIYQQAFNPLETVILEEEVSAKNLKLSSREGKLKINNYSANRLELETTAEDDKFLFLSDTYYPGWQVYLDGKKGKIYKANYAFRAVLVPAGQHQVVFLYQPLSFKIGLRGSFLFLILILIFLIKFRSKGIAA